MKIGGRKGLNCALKNRILYIRLFWKFWIAVNINETENWFFVGHNVKRIFENC